MGSVGLLLAVFTIVASVYISRFLPSVFRSRNKLLVFALLCLCAIGLAKIMAELERAYNVGRLSLLTPLPAFAIFMVLLYGRREAIAASMLLAIVVGLSIASSALVESSMIGVLALATGSITAVLSTRSISRRSKLIKTGVLIGVAQALTVFGFEIILTPQPEIVFQERNWLYAFAGGVGVGILTTVALPFLEYCFGVATDISLLELQNQSHPLRRQLVLRAPGTNQHSQAVGILAEAGAEAIGANAVLARVASHFHDIGKINKPEYFVENQPAGENPHDGLSIPMSTLIIASHIKDGVDLAKAYGLPLPLVEIIAEHHGTCLIEYFYNLYRANPSPRDELGEQFFRYPGPKPRTKESAIVLLADGIEASFRALRNPSPARIKTLCHEMIMKRLMDGQLDLCELTFEELARIRDAFVRVLISMSHARISYQPPPLERRYTVTYESQHSL